jgi:hypothetical protein
MTLTDIISKITQYAKKVIVNDNSSTTAASIAQAGAGDTLSITGTTGIGASITTTTGTALKLQQNNPDLAVGGTLDFFPTTGGEMVFNGGTDGRFGFINSSVSPTKATVFLGANVGIGISVPETPLHVTSTIRVGRQNSASEGGEIQFAKSLDDSVGWTIELFGSSDSPRIRMVDVTTGTSVERFSVKPSGTIGMPTLPVYANNAAAITGGLISRDVYQTATGELRIVV